jgi:hypothetical protein
MLKIILPLIAVLALTACAGMFDVPMQQLSKDLTAAEATSLCRSPRATQIQKWDCMDSVDRPVWQREAPGTLDIYSRWIAVQRAAAVRFDNGTLSADATTAAYKEANEKLWLSVAERQQRNAEQSAQQKQNMADFASLLLGFGGAFLSGYNQGAGYVQAPAPVVMTTCTGNGATVNCLSY